MSRFKLFFLNLFEKFKTKGKWFFPLFLFLLIPNVNAAQLNGGQFGWSWNGSTSAGWYQDPAGQNLPKSFSLSGNSSSSNYVLNIYSGNYDFNEFTYFYLDTCSNFGQYNFYVDISNSSYGNSYFQTGSYRPIYDYGSCNMGNTNLTHHLVIEIPVGRYYYSDSFYTADSYLKFRTTTSYSSNVQINYAFVSNEKLSDSANMQTILNTMNSSMTTMNNNITSQSNAIQNSISSQTSSINGNIDQEFSDLKNYDHTYNNNASDNLNGQSELNSFDSKTNQIKNSIHLDTNQLDFTLNDNAFTWIWDIITSFRGIHAKITMFITFCLSFAIIKMVINR